MKISFPFNSFGHTLFETVCEDIIELKTKQRKQEETKREAEKKRKRGPRSPKPSFVDPLNNDKAEIQFRELIIVKADKYNH